MSLDRSWKISLFDHNNGKYFVDIINSYLGDQKSIDIFLASSDQSYCAERDKLIPQFLDHVCKGEEAAVRKMLSLTPQLALEKGTIVDYAGRRFENITAFQYALWALDKYMWKTIRVALTNEQAAAQFTEHHESKDLAYVEKNGRHFDLSPLKKAMQVTIDNLLNDKQDSKQWIKDVGGAQALLPVHMIEEIYCQNEYLLSPIPEFDQATLKRGAFYYDRSPIFPIQKDKELGSEFALIRGGDEYTSKCEDYPTAGKKATIELNLADLTKLYEVRMDDYNMLKLELAGPTTRPRSL